jgi:hypothetical protein
VARKSGPVSKSTKHRRAKQAKALGCEVKDLPDGRGKSPKPKGSKHYRWNSGRLRDQMGYVLIRVGASHPIGDSNGYVREHILVWLSAGNVLPKGHVIHHINGDRSDNRLSNLKLMTISEHNRLHNRQRKRDPKTGRFVKSDARRQRVDAVSEGGQP